MAEQLRVVGAAGDARRLHPVGGSRQDVAQQAHEVVGVGSRALRRAGGVVEQLGAEVGARRGHAPVAQSAREVLLVELHVPPIARVARVAAPDLHRRLGIAHEGHGLPVSSARGHHVGPVGAAVAFEVRLERLGERAQGGVVVAIRRQRAASPRQVHVGDEEPELEVREELFDPAPAHPHPAPHPRDRRRPLVAGAVGALRQPDPGRAVAEVPLVRGHGDPQLEVDRLLAQQQGEVAVCRGARDQADVPRVVQAPKRPDEVAVQPLELLEAVPVIAFPVPGTRHEVRPSLTLELTRVLPGGLDPGTEELLDLALERRCRKLLGEHRRDVDRRMGAVAAFGEAGEGVQERKVAADGNFGEPVAAVRPAAVAQNEGQMRVQDQREIADRGLGHDGSSTVKHTILSPETTRRGPYIPRGFRTP